MLAAGNTSSLVAYAGWAFTVIFGLAAVAAFLTGTVRKSVAEQHDRDLQSQDDHIKRLDARVVELEAAVKECERRDADKAVTIANLSSQIESADSMIAVAKDVAARLARLERLTGGVK